jgi:phosphatidylglycerophosphate synthase
MVHPEFAGDRKASRSILHGPEQALIRWAIAHMPPWLQGYHLTLMSFLWSALTALFGYLARTDLNWFWGVSGMVVCQYLTDSFDGSLGRARRAGTIKWGFYMDHFLDYVFLCTLVLAGYFIAPPGVGVYFFLLMMLLGGFLVSSFLLFAATNRFVIAVHGIGPTELRIVLLALNTLIIFTGTSHFRITVPLLCAACLVGLAVLVKGSSDEVWALDMAKKAIDGGS